MRRTCPAQSVRHPVQFPLWPPGLSVPDRLRLAKPPTFRPARLDAKCPEHRSMLLRLRVCVGSGQGVALALEDHRIGQVEPKSAIAGGPTWVSVSNLCHVG